MRDPDGSQLTSYFPQNRISPQLQVFLRNKKINFLVFKKTFFTSRARHLAGEKKVFLKTSVTATQLLTTIRANQDTFLPHPHPLPPTTTTDPNPNSKPSPNP